MSPPVIPAPLRSTLRVGALGAALFAAVATGACGPTDELSRAAARLTAEESARPFTLPRQTLTAHTGEAFELQAETSGRFTLLFFGYTYCPDICPIQMATANAAFERLTPEERSRVVTLFVTMDPQRDSLARLTEWLGAMGSSAVGLRGSTADLERLLDAMGFVMPPTTSRQPVPGGGPDDYLVAHPTALFLITPDGLGRFQYGYDRGTPAQIVEDLRTLMALDWDGIAPTNAAAGADPVAGAATATTGARAAAHGGPRVTEVRIGESGGGARAGVYARLESAGDADALVGISSPAAARGSLHVMEGEGGMATMTPRSRLDIPGGGSLELRPGREHGMLEELHAALEPGDTVEVTFSFTSGAEVTVRAPVLSLVDLRGG